MQIKSARPCEIKENIGTRKRLPALFLRQAIVMRRAALERKPQPDLAKGRHSRGHAENKPQTRPP